MQPCADDGLAYRMRGPRHLIGEPSERRQLMGGVIEVLPLIPNRPRAKPSTMFRAIPDRAGKSPMDFTTERDARRWLEECQIGGNPAGFLHEMAGRRRR